MALPSSSVRCKTRDSVLDEATARLPMGLVLARVEQPHLLCVESGHRDRAISRRPRARNRCPDASAGREELPSLRDTRLIRVFTSHRAEDAHIAKAVSLSEASDLGSVGLDQGVH